MKLTSKRKPEAPVGFIRVTEERITSALLDKTDFDDDIYINVDYIIGVQGNKALNCTKIIVMGTEKLYIYVTQSVEEVLDMIADSYGDFE